MCEEDGYLRIKFDTVESIRVRLAKILAEVKEMASKLLTFNSMYVVDKTDLKKNLFCFDLFNPQSPFLQQLS